MPIKKSIKLGEINKVLLHYYTLIISQIFLTSVYVIHYEVFVRLCL